MIPRLYSKLFLAAGILLALFVIEATLAESKPNNKISSRFTKEQDAISRVHSLVEYFENLRMREESKSFRGHSDGHQNKFAEKNSKNKGSLEPRTTLEINQQEEMLQTNAKAKENRKSFDEENGTSEKEQVENINKLKILSDTSLKEKNDSDRILKEMQRALDDEQADKKRLIEELRVISIKDTESQETVKELQGFLRNERAENANLKKKLDQSAEADEKAQETERFLKEIKELLEKERVENRNTLKLLKEMSLKDDQQRESVEELQKTLDFERTEKERMVKQLEDVSSERQGAEVSCEELKETVNSLQNKVNKSELTHEDEIRLLSSQYESKLSAMQTDLDAITKEINSQDKLIAKLSTTSIDAENKLNQKEQELSYSKRELFSDTVKEGEQLNELRNLYETKLSALERELAIMSDCRNQLVETTRSLTTCETMKQSNEDEIKLLTIDKNNIIAKLEKEVEKMKETNKMEKAKDKEFSNKSAHRVDPNCRNNGRSRFVYM